MVAKSGSTATRASHHAGESAPPIRSSHLWRLWRGHGATGRRPSLFDGINLDPRAAELEAQPGRDRLDVDPAADVRAGRSRADRLLRARARIELNVIILDAEDDMVPQRVFQPRPRRPAVLPAA